MGFGLGLLPQLGLGRREETGQAFFPQSRAGALGPDSPARGGHLTTVLSKACFPLKHQARPALALVTVLGDFRCTTREMGSQEAVREGRGQVSNLNPDTFKLRGLVCTASPLSFGFHLVTEVVA